MLLEETLHPVYRKCSEVYSKSANTLILVAHMSLSLSLEIKRKLCRPGLESCVCVWLLLRVNVQCTFFFVFVRLPFFCVCDPASEANNYSWLDHFRHNSVANTFQPALEVATRGAETPQLRCKALKWGLRFNMARIIEIRPGMYKLQPSSFKKKKSMHSQITEMENY